MKELSSLDSINIYLNFIPLIAIQILKTCINIILNLTLIMEYFHYFFYFINKREEKHHIIMMITMEIWKLNMSKTSHFCPLKSLLMVWQIRCIFFRKVQHNNIRLRKVCYWAGNRESPLPPQHKEFMIQSWIFSFVFWQ